MYVPPICLLPRFDPEIEEEYHDTVLPPIPTMEPYLSSTDIATLEDWEIREEWVRIGLPRRFEETCREDLARLSLCRMPKICYDQHHSGDEQIRIRLFLDQNRERSAAYIFQYLRDIYNSGFISAFEWKVLDELRECYHQGKLPSPDYTTGMFDETDTKSILSHRTSY